MRLAGPRYKYPVSDAELLRRLAAIQSAMKKQEIDCCITQSQNIIFDSCIRYLVDMPAHPYGTTILIPQEGPMTLINHGPDNDNDTIPDFIRNVDRLYSKA